MHEYYLQITGKTNIEKPLDPEKEISVALKRLACTGINKKPLENGSYSYTHKFENLDEVKIIVGNDVIKGKKKKASQSQKLRYEIRNLWNEQFSGKKEFEQFYSQCMTKFINEIQEQREAAKIS